MRPPAYLTCSTIGVALCACVFFLIGCGQAPQTSNDSVYGTAKSTPSKDSATERYDLSRDEDRGGHTLKKHVGRSDEQLRERLQRERDISAASTWTNREIAEETVAAGIRAERGKIENWERRGERRANLALHFGAGRAIGRSLRRGESETVNCTEAVLVLKADGADNFYVLTTYPEARE